MEIRMNESRLVTGAGEQLVYPRPGLSALAMCCSLDLQGRPCVKLVPQPMVLLGEGAI